MKKLPRILQTFLVTGGLLSSMMVHACMWDSDTLADEKKKKPEIAEIIFGTEKESVDTPRLQKRIAELKANPRETEAAWWNDLAGAYLRLSKPQEAANLLEPVLKKFESDYGVHANLGTAYHLLGRYQDAEKEIARDLEINPDAHFGLEKFHLALLQYLCRDQEYQRKHVYVEEWTVPFFRSEDVHLRFIPKEIQLAEERATAPELAGTSLLLTQPEGTNLRPAYFEKWDLANDPKFEAGVKYMAKLNPKQPACFTMLGVLCLTRSDFNLAARAFEKAIFLGAPEKEFLQGKIAQIDGFIQESQGQARSTKIAIEVGSAVLLLVATIGFLLLRNLVRYFARK